ncbi:arginyltransferase [Helicobacter saguini]|uniref:Arginyltransferase n=1 Tax=Helicobacter saguini TaxID=1548018 RepID=A0A347VN34_9HELI|nr:arginyltransferase [Helicobacter saguini]MWV61919.1 arginyltransferase [Helicobacter saguini]MWV67406.1 arginyltransferase [Helicobacter saguini]MWV69759.1 arginyltransferase [Helicobacter saguini]MWV73024.1 arginyltransferase [Helicobacter saguini]TLD95599.1 arginyltransferase [Helicobacter saguini]
MEFFDFLSEVHPCSYYENRASQFRYLGIKDCTPYFYAGLLERGYRRFGEYYFVPRCPSCRDCVTIRQLVQEFEISKNMRQVLKKNVETFTQIRRPLTNEARVSLYVKYHNKMTDKKGWSVNNIDIARYTNSFVAGSEVFGYEMCMYRDGGLIGVSYFDIVQDSLSANYFFYDHSYEKYSLGTLNILLLLNLSRKLGLKYFYPGYWIKNHKSMGYKYRFRPFEALLNDADLFDRTFWKRYD